MRKKLLLSIFFSGLISGFAFAQSETSIEERLAKLEAQLAQQNTTIAYLQSEVQSVVKQNLALKKNLFLQPTISEVKTDEFVYKLHEVTGHKNDSTVHLVLTITNTTPQDVDNFQFQTINFMDENGIQNPSFKNFEVVVGGKNDGYKLNSIYSEAPTKLDIYLYKFDPSAQYVRILDGKVYNTTITTDRGFKDLHRSFTLCNLPIKWVESTD